MRASAWGCALLLGVRDPRPQLVLPCCTNR